jgi:hypothetical protein
VADKPNPAFILLDTNKDCVITPDERSAAGARNTAGKGQRKH